MSTTQVHTDSIDGGDRDPDPQKKQKSRRPASMSKPEMTCCEERIHGGGLLLTLFDRYRFQTATTQSVAVRLSKIWILYHLLEATGC